MAHGDYLEDKQHVNQIKWLVCRYSLNNIYSSLVANHRSYGKLIFDLQMGHGILYPLPGDVISL